MFKKLEERLNMLSRDMKDIFNHPNWTSIDETTRSEMKITSDGIHDRLDVEDKKSSKFHDIEVENIQNETHRGKKE